MDIFAKWFLDRFKPWFMGICKYAGILTIFFGLSLLSTDLFNWDIGYTFMAILFFTFSIDHWAKDILLEKRIEEIIDTHEEDDIKLIVNNNLIDYPKLNGIINRTKRKLQEEGYYGEKFVGTGESVVENKNNISKKIEEYVWRKYRLAKK